MLVSHYLQPPRTVITHLVGRLNQSLGINGGTETESDTGAENLAVSQSGDTLVVDLSLNEGVRVELVLAGDLEANTAGRAALGVPSGLGTGLNLSVDVVVVRGSKDVQAVGGSDRSGVLGDAVTDGSGVLGDLSSLDIVANLGTGKEAVMADNDITVEGGALQQVEEGTSMEEGLAEVEVELRAFTTAGGEELSENLGLEAVGDGVVELDLGVEGVRGRPRLGQGQAYRNVRYRAFSCAPPQNRTRILMEGLPVGLSLYLASIYICTQVVKILPPCTGGNFRNTVPGQ